MLTRPKGGAVQTNLAGVVVAVNENDWMLLSLVCRLEALHVHLPMHISVAFCGSSELPVEVDKESRAAARGFVVLDGRLINHVLVSDPDRIILDHLDRHAEDGLRAGRRIRRRRDVWKESTKKCARRGGNRGSGTKHFKPNEEKKVVEDDEEVRLSNGIRIQHLSLTYIAKPRPMTGEF